MLALSRGTAGAVVGWILAAVPACHRDHEDYTSYRDCWTDHSINESLTPAQSIAVCCLEHAIGGIEANVVCGADQTTCETYVTANLTTGDATTTEITAGCADYINQRGM